MAERPPTTTVNDLTDRYDALLIDAFGVLVHSHGAFPGAPEFIEHLNATDFPYRIVTNDSSRLPETCAEKYGRDGVEVAPERILTSGLLLEPYFRERDLVGSRCVVLGTRDSRDYVERAGGEVVGLDDDFEAVVFGDDEGFSFRETANQLLTRLIERLDAGHAPALILPNPDNLFQVTDERWGVAVGAMASMFETILADRYPDRTPRFDRLGKPHPPIYQTAVDRLGTENVAMLGDQLTTDIAGANAFGMDSVLVAGSLEDIEGASDASGIRPDYLLESLEPASD